MKGLYTALGICLMISILNSNLANAEKHGPREIQWPDDDDKVAQKSTRNNDQDLESKVDSFIHALLGCRNIVGMSVAITKGNETLLAKV